MSIKKRVFIVGCPRSGSTLLQNLFLNYQQCFSFPETHFFYPVFNTNKVFQVLGLVNRKNAKEKISNLIEELQVEDDALKSFVTSNSSRASYWCSLFYRILDHVSFQQKKEIWIEKTPMHLHYIKQIASHIPNYHFVHILRSGVDVVSSVYNYSNKFPESWSSKRSIDSCIERWKNDIQISKAYLGKENHTFVRYEDLVERKPELLQGLCNNLGLEYQPDYFTQVKKESFK